MLARAWVAVGVEGRLDVELARVAAGVRRVRRADPVLLFDPRSVVEDLRTLTRVYGTLVDRAREVQELGAVLEERCLGVAHVTVAVAVLPDAQDGVEVAHGLSQDLRAQRP